MLIRVENLGPAGERMAERFYRGTNQRSSPPREYRRIDFTPEIRMVWKNERRIECAYVYVWSMCARVWVCVSFLSRSTEDFVYDRRPLIKYLVAPIREDSKVLRCYGTDAQIYVGCTVARESKLHQTRTRSRSFPSFYAIYVQHNCTYI